MCGVATARLQHRNDSYIASVQTEYSSWAVYDRACCDGGLLALAGDKPMCRFQDKHTLLANVDPTIVVDWPDDLNRVMLCTNDLPVRYAMVKPHYSRVAAIVS
jgi:hypothetical protein